MDQADDNSLTALLTKRASEVPRDRKYMHRIHVHAQKGEQKNAFNERREY